MRHIILAACLAYASGALAAPAPVWLNLGGVSWHPSASGLSGVNPGLGLEYWRGNGDFMAAGVYRNSQRRSSRYAVYARQLAASEHVSLGVFAGLVDGYLWRDGGVAPLAAPYVSITGERVGINLVYIPRVEKQASDALALQIKWRLR